VWNVFLSAELEDEATGAEDAPVQREGDRVVAREIEHFSIRGLTEFS
jgi:hypothetical protein